VASAVYSGGLGFTVGRASQKTTQTDDSNVKKGSLALFAGNLLNVHGSKLFAGKDMALAGSDVNITAAENSHSTQIVSEQQRCGLTLALSGMAGSALNGVARAKAAAGAALKTAGMRG
jgi:filamentous hemagglutinin